MTVRPLKHLWAVVLGAALLAASSAGAWPAHGGGGGGGGSAPVLAWAQHGSSSFTTTAGGNTIHSGDLLIAAEQFSSNSGSTDALGVCPSGFTQFAYATPTSNTSMTNIWCWKIAGGSESGAYTFTYTTAGNRTDENILIDVTGANASTPIDQSSASCYGCSSNTSTATTGTLPTLATSHDLLIGFLGVFFVASPGSPPTGQTWAVTSAACGGNSCLVASSSTLSSSTGPSLTYNLTRIDAGNAAIIAVRP